MNGLVEKNSLILYRMLKVYVKYGKIMGKVHEKNIFKQSMLLETYKSFITQKTNGSLNDFEKDLIKNTQLRILREYNGKN